MVFNKFNNKILLHILSIVVSTVCSAYFLNTNKLIPAILFGVIILIIAFMLIELMNETNRKIAFFIDSVKNEDATLKFPENTKNEAIKELHTSLNKVNKILTESKIQIEHKEKFYEALIQHSATGLLSIDENGDFEILNNTSKSYLNVEYTSNIHRLKQSNNELYHVLKNIKPGQKNTVKTFVNNDLYYLSVKCTEINYYSKKLRLVSLHNIKLELEEKEIESWQKLFRVITHEIMNSLAPIISVSNTLGKLFHKDENLKNCEEISNKVISDTVMGLNVIEDMSNGLMNFVNSYRSLNKIPKPDYKEIKIKPWIENLIVMGNKIIDTDNVTLKYYIKPGTSYFMGDENLLNQVLINLFKNANEALTGIGDAVINLKCSSNYAGKIKLEISDNGTGINEDAIEQIFIPFFTTKDNGTGIGLSLCRQIIKLHNGDISVRSKIGEGTTFYISL